jgi:cytochrome c peroxidase
MNKLLLFPMLAISVGMVACSGSHQPADQDNAKNLAADKELLTKAQTFFQALPSTAEVLENPMSPEKIALGKLLYFDTRLSATGNNSCNSCHNLSTFGVDNKAFSTGDAGKLGGRNSPTSFNAALHSMQFWDGRAKTVEEQAGMPILNPVEMAIPNEAALEKKLAAVPMYVEKFKKVFPVDKNPISFKNVALAIGAFERTLLTPSRFDKFLAGETTAMNAEEKAGLSLFMETGCTTCHSGPSLGGTMMMKFGVHTDYRPLTGSTNGDNGLMDLTKKESDKDIFKVCGLRNVEKTSPYFHDGSVKSLNDAVRIMAKTQNNKDLNPEQVTSIVKFLGALTHDIPDDVKAKPVEL